MIHSGVVRPWIATPPAHKGEYFVFRENAQIGMNLSKYLEILEMVLGNTALGAFSSAGSASHALGRHYGSGLSRQSCYGAEGTTR